jgi:hypothetical protein
VCQQLFLEPLEKQQVKSVNLSADDLKGSVELTRHDTTLETQPRDMCHLMCCRLFSSIKTIYALHTTFLRDLEIELQSPNHVKLGKMFIELVPCATHISFYAHAHISRTIYI